jgi:hypothetical protein
LFITLDLVRDDKMEANPGNKIPVIKQNGESRMNELKKTSARLIIFPGG